MSAPNITKSLASRIRIEKNGRKIAITIEGGIALLVTALVVMTYLIHLLR